MIENNSEVKEMKKDLLIVYQLRKNSRESLTNMSKITKIPVSTIYEKLRVNEGNMIMKHTSLVDFSKLGFHARANIFFKSKKETKSELKNHLLHNVNINSLYKVNNGFDYLAEVVFKDMKELEEFVDNVEEKYGLEKKSIFYVIEDLKREDFMSDPVMAPVLKS